MEYSTYEELNLQIWDDISEAIRRNRDDIDDTSWILDDFIQMAERQFGQIKLTLEIRNPAGPRYVDTWQSDANYKVLIITGVDALEVKHAIKDILKNYLEEFVHRYHLNEIWRKWRSMPELVQDFGIPRISRKELMEIKAGFLKKDFVTVRGKHYPVENGVLDLRGLNITFITEIEGLEQLKNLEKLDLSWNRIKEIKGLAHLTHLKDLYLHNNRITEIKGLEFLTSLRRLSLHNNPIEVEELHLIGKSAKYVVSYCQDKKQKKFGKYDQRKLDTWF